MNWRWIIQRDLFALQKPPHFPASAPPTGASPGGDRPRPGFFREICRKMRFVHSVIITARYKSTREVASGVDSPFLPAIGNPDHDAVVEPADRVLRTPREKCSDPFKIVTIRRFISPTHRAGAPIGPNSPPPEPHRHRSPPPLGGSSPPFSGLRRRCRRLAVHPRASLSDPRPPQVRQGPSPSLAASLWPVRSGGPSSIDRSGWFVRRVCSTLCTTIL